VRLDVVRQGIVPITRGGNAGRLDDDDRGTAVGGWAVLDASGDDEDAARGECDHPLRWITELDAQLAVEDHEEFVGVVVGVPNVGATDLGDADVVVVDPGRDAWAPEFVEGLQDGVEFDGFIAHPMIVERLTPPA